jgi:hypothetical protein
MRTPLPAASPSALTTTGKSRCARRYACASARSVNEWKVAVGIWQALMRFLAKTLEPSISAAAALGPNTRSPASSKRSTIPAQSGASGPTTVRSMDSRVAQASSPSTSSAPMSTHSATPAMPAFPGAQNTRDARGDCAIFQASACSRPPPPTTRTFMALAPGPAPAGMIAPGSPVFLVSPREVPRIRAGRGVAQPG